MGTLRDRRGLDRTYRFLRRIATRHRRMGHDVVFVAVNETRLILHCRTCNGVRGIR